MVELTAATREETSATHSTTSSASASPSPLQEQVEPQRKRKQCVFKKRKATHTIRKEHKAALEKEIEAPQARLEEIKLQVLVQQDEAAKSYHDRAVENAVRSRSRTL
ncbi:Phospholipid-transporting ATPase 2 [Phytophthora cinnamomi]|uniref:Phospholipid-transporting ATPase 2 n=1 Tax=Phytophthora cinnamomi TaxID=4785 RepID=UPI00355AAD2E|nr:Phospholipid-transporting ATPase 2 [Phytophthora cinnamomi]